MPVDPDDADLPRSYPVAAKYGKEDCPSCGGTGRVPVPNPPGHVGPPAIKLCRCALVDAVRDNLERGMRGLSKAPRVPKSQLLSSVDKNLWVTASPGWFRAHLRHVGLRKGANWKFFVATDAELIQAWLATASMSGQEIHDADAAEMLSRRSIAFRTLTDLAVPPALLVIRLGVKSARNAAMPEVLLEALRMRQHEGSPTWVWDQPERPLAQGHLCWSPEVDEEMESWDRCFGDEAYATPEVDEKQALVNLSISSQFTFPTSPPVRVPIPRAQVIPEAAPKSTDLLAQLEQVPRKKPGKRGGKLGGSFGGSRS